MEKHCLQYMSVINKQKVTELHVIPYHFFENHLIHPGAAGYA